MERSDGFSSVKEMAARVGDTFGTNSKVTEMFEGCMMNTLKKTVKKVDDGSVFMITGDIPAMWLRDSSCQLRPFLFLAEKNKEIQDIIVGVIEKQMQCIQIDPYANAFNEKANGNCYNHDITEMKPELWERKYELDSLCFPIQIAYLLWKKAGISRQFTKEWITVAKKIVTIFQIEQDHEHRSSYSFIRPNAQFTETLSREGKGALVKSNIGLIWSGFRPSDDACVYGYLVPANMLASVVLGYMSEIAGEIYRDLEFSSLTAKMSGTIRDAIELYGIMPGTEEPVYAYEVDGYGQYNRMDDANLPSLLSAPYIGYCTKKEKTYSNTRNMIWSDANPFYYKGKALEGIGSPHSKPGYVWSMSIAMKGITAASKQEKMEAIQVLIHSDADTMFVHEAITKDDPFIYTRPWFSWANSLFCELVLNYCGYELVT